MKLKQSHALILFFILLAFYLYFYKYNNILEKMTNINNEYDKTDEHTSLKINAIKKKNLKYTKLNYNTNNVSYLKRTTGMFTDIDNLVTV
tara:strand:- start:214 stop:483 length:270 start_codon:yes stop_codon:yes gene_type:complete